MCPGCGAPTRRQRNPEAKDPGIAVLLELLPGFMFATFGIGNIYAGNVGVGVAILISNWVLNVINFLLLFLFIGICTWPICWLGMALLSTLLAHSAATATRRRG